MRSVFVLVLMAGAMGVAWLAAGALRDTEIDRGLTTSSIAAPPTVPARHFSYASYVPERVRMTNRSPV